MNTKILRALMHSTWLIEREAGLSMLDLYLRTLQSGKEWSYGLATAGDHTKTDYAVYGKLFTGIPGVIEAPNDTYDLKFNFKGFEGATTAIIPIKGPIMQEDYCGSPGTETIGNLVRMAGQTKSVTRIVFVMNSPGGSTAGLLTLANLVKASSKETIAFVDGLCCSAAYFIASACNKIIASNGMSIIGSIGTMWSAVDASKAMEKQGYIVREFYATASKDKNRSTNEALKNNGKLIIEELLDPMNNEFLGFATRQRPAILEHKDAVLTGKIYTATDAMPLKLIDAIAPIEDVLAGNTDTNSSPPKKSTQMPTKNHVFQAALKAANAQAFAPIEGGFRLSEDELSAIDQVLTANADDLAMNKDTIKQLNARIKELEASTTTAGDLKAAQDKASDLQAQLNKANGELKTAQDDLAAEKAKPGAAFASTAADQERKAENSKEIEDTNNVILKEVEGMII